MPTYEYRCEACKYSFEKFQSMKEDPLKSCPKCKKRTVKRLIGSGAGFVFKGSGFYVTDYRSDGYKKAKAADGKPKDAAEKAAKKESKPSSQHKNKKHR